MDQAGTYRALVGAGKRSEAVENYMIEAVGIPAEYIEFMKADPSWANMEAMAHTLAYDGMIMGDTQSGQPLPTDRWNVNVPVSVAVGENSPAFLHHGAKALVNILGQAEYRMLAGLDHSAVVMAADALAKEMSQFFQG